MPLHLTVGHALFVNAGSTLNVRFGSDVITPRLSSDGQINVTGLGSALTASSTSIDDGSLNVTAGGVVQTDNADINDALGTVSGAGSQWIDTGTIQVGESSEGTLNIAAGGRVDSNGGTVGGNGGTGTINVDGMGSQWINSDFLRLGDGGAQGTGQGIMKITAGGFVRNTSAVVGGFIGTGDVTVNGPTSQWINSGSLTIGFDEGENTLNILAGGRVDSNGGFVGGEESGRRGTGTVNVDGTGSQWINSGFLRVGTGIALGGAGQSSEGTLNITAGGRVDSNGGTVGGSGGTGTVNVDGTGSQWINSGFLQLGDGIGQGIMNITAGGFVRNTSAVVGGLLSAGDVTVNGHTTQWINSGSLTIGIDEGENTLDILAGGRVDCNGGTVGGSGGTGTVNVNGTGSQWINSGFLQLGAGIGQGIMNITAGGFVRNTSAVLGGGLIGAGDVTVAGAASTWMISSGLLFGVDSISNGGAGTVRIQTGGTVSVAQETVLFADDELRLEGGTFSSTDISFQGGGTFAWTSGTLHVGIFRGSLVVPSGGILAPGNSAGSTEVRVNYSQMTGGILQIEIGGPAATQHDRVTVTGDAFLGGDLQLALLGGFLPSPASTFIIFDARGISGVFDNVANGQRLTTSDGNGSFLVHYGNGSPFNPDQIVLSSFLAALPGDYNQDGTVNAADYTVWRNHLGQTFNLPNKNPLAQTPNLVDREDFTFWKSRYGQPTDSGSQASTVPEPSSMLLLTIAFGMFPIAARRRLSHSSR